MRLIRWKSSLLVLALAVALAACNGSNASPNVTPTALPDPIALLKQTAAQVKAAKGLRFKLQLTGAPAFVDTRKTISFISANGQYVQPDRVYAKIVAKLVGIPGEVEVVAIGDRQYMHNAVLTANQWLQMQFSPGFNAATLIQSDKGIESAIGSFKNVKMVGREDLFGTPVYHITGTAATADISALTVGLITGTGDVTADLYVDVANSQADQVVLVQPDTKTSTDAPTTWTLETYDYNAADISVDEPKVAPGPSATVPVLGAQPAIPQLPADTPVGTPASTLAATLDADPTDSTNSTATIPVLTATTTIPVPTSSN